MPERISIIKALTDEQILTTRAVMLQLRPSIATDAYLPTVKRMMQSDGYQLAAVLDQDVVKAVAGYRFMEMLYCGRVMYVDDLNTDHHARSAGFGKLLMDWLKNEAVACGCAELHLDSGLQREQTHRFYFRERLTVSAFHFRVALVPS